MECRNSTCANVTDSTTAPLHTDPPAPHPPPVPTLEDLLSVFWEYRVSQVLGLYVFPVIIGLGTLGNVLSFLVLIRKSMRSSSTCFYMIFLAVADTMVLYFDTLRKWLSYINGYDAVTHTDVGCKLFTFLSYFSFSWSAWLLVAMTIERFIAIHFPLHAVRMATPGRARKVILLLLVIFLVFNCHFFWTVTKDDRDQCIPETEYASFHDEVVPWLDATVYSFAPFAVLITFNILIIRDNRIATRNRRTMRGRNHQRSAQSDSRTRFHQKLTITLLSVSFTYLLCSCPKVVLIGIRDSHFNFYKDNGLPDFHQISLYLLVSRISDLFLYINHSINFVLYSIHGQRFRRELKNLLLCRRGRIRRASTISMSLDVVSNRATSETIITGHITSTVAETQDQNGNSCHLTGTVNKEYVPKEELNYV